MRLYLFVWPKAWLNVNYLIKSLYSMLKINLIYFHYILPIILYLLYDDYSVTWWIDLETVLFIEENIPVTEIELLDVSYYSNFLVFFNKLYIYWFT